MTRIKMKFILQLSTETDNAVFNRGLISFRAACRLRGILKES